MSISEPPCPQLCREWGQSPLHEAHSGFTCCGACVGAPRHSSLPVLCSPAAQGRGLGPAGLGQAHGLGPEPQIEEPWGALSWLLLRRRRCAGNSGGEEGRGPRRLPPDTASQKAEAPLASPCSCSAS